MITLHLSSLLALLTGVPLLIMGILSAYYSLRSRHRSISETESIYACNSCGNVYAFARTRPMDRCPRCGNLNEAVRT